MQATVRYLTNGFSVVGTGDPGTPLQSYYAASFDEAVYWIGVILGVTPETTAPEAVQVEPRSMNDPLISQEAMVFPLTGGGYITRQLTNRNLGRVEADEYCVSMDEVHTALTTIFTYTPPQEEFAGRHP